MEGRFSVGKKDTLIGDVVSGLAVLDRKPPAVANRKFAPTIRRIDVVVFLIVGRAAGLLKIQRGLLIFFCPTGS
jgi:hypothetical protein